MTKPSVVISFLFLLEIAQSQAQFREFQFTFGKTYTSQEVATRAQIFSQSMDRVAIMNQANQANGGKSVFGQTQFSDLTPAEFQSKYLTFIPESQTTSPRLTPKVAPLATSVLPSLDWRNVNGVNYMTPVKNQEDCGACWAFSVAEVVESYQMLAGVYTKPLSAQQLNSCDTRSIGCAGGTPQTAFPYIVQHGLTSEQAYPYTATDSTCASPTLSLQTGRRLLAITRSPTAKPTTRSPTPKPSTKSPVPKPTTKTPTSKPTKPPTNHPTTKSPTSRPTTKFPTLRPTTKPPTSKPTTKAPPTKTPSFSPTKPPTNAPSYPPTHSPTVAPTLLPTTAPTSSPTIAPTSSPTSAPTLSPTSAPTSSPTTASPTTQAPSQSPYPIIAKISSWDYVDDGESNLQLALQPPPSNPYGGPISVCLAADALQDYVGGILTVCDGSPNHCLQAAGYGTDGGVNYWLLRNQWGKNWGEAGYVRVQMGQNLCQLSTTLMTYPIGVIGG